jgi:hypothetical protein
MPILPEDGDFDGSYPPHPHGWSCGIIRLPGNCILILGLQLDEGKILKRKQVSMFQSFKVAKTSARELCRP